MKHARYLKAIYPDGECLFVIYKSGACAVSRLTSAESTTMLRIRYAPHSFGQHIIVIFVNFQPNPCLP